MCILCYSYNYIKLCINFKWMSDKNVKYINFKYNILVPPEILVKIRHWLDDTISLGEDN